MFATDRQIIERLLIPALMQVVLHGIRRSLGEDAGVLDPVSTLLSEALCEPVAGLAPQRVGKLVRRSKRVTEAAMAAVVDKVMGVQYLAIARYTANLAERDVIVVGADSAFARAWDMMAEIIDLGAEDLEPLDADATTAAHELRRILEDMGFYRPA